MLPSFLKSSVGKVAIWQPTVRRILTQYEKLNSLTNAELRKESLSLRYRAQGGEPLNRLLVESYAVVRQAADRALSMRHYEVQLLGGIAMHSGMIAVMQTGEGKTLTASLPLYLNALTGRGAHLVTANDYLAERDAELLRPMFELLGMEIGVVVNATSRASRPAAYRADITYSTAKEIGFDFLRDRLLKRRIDEGGWEHVAKLMQTSEVTDANDVVQRELNFVLVDEADSTLIDEAKTPLIISSIPEDDSGAKVALCHWANQVTSEFEKDEHYEYDSEKRNLDLTGAGRRLVRKLSKPPAIAGVSMIEIYAQVELALFVDIEYIRDRQYVVKDGEIVIVDEFTGRMTEGRKWRAGLHQAIEARENIEITFETSEAARITIQDLFLQYELRCGMTGTVANSARELKKIYGTGTIQIPTNRPPQRKRLPDRVFRTEPEKWQGIVDQIVEMHSSGRPVLVGTRSIDKSEILSRLLDDRRIEHSVLNARHLANEAEIVSAAGEVGRITVATNMAGRGTDIKLSEEARKMGGLHVICSEVHDSARIDRQLIGRCGRQGDPGTFQIFMSLEDEILHNAYGAKAADRFRRSGNSQSLTHFSRIFKRAQSRIESQHFRSRKSLMERERQRQLAQREMGQDPYVDTIV